METLRRGLGIIVLVSGILQSGSLIGAEKRPTGLPNIVVIFADDRRACSDQICLVHEVVADAVRSDMPRPTNDKRNSVSSFPDV